MKRTKFEPDRLVMVPPGQVGLAAMQVCNQLQNHDPEIQVATIGTVFVLLLQKHGIKSAGGILDVCNNILERTKNIVSPELLGAVSYVRREL